MNIFDQSSRINLKKTCVQLGLALFFNNEEEYKRLYEEIKKMRIKIDEEVIQSMQKELDVEPKQTKHLLNINELRENQK